MEILIGVNLALKVIAIILLLLIFVKINHLIKAKKTVMAALTDFQAEAARIDTATQSILTYVQAAGMSPADQDAALAVVREATDKLVAAVPATPSAG